MIKKQFELAKKLVELEVAEVNELYANDPAGECYLLEATFTDGDIEIMPQTELTFHGVDDFIKIAMTCSMNCYITTTLNREQNIAPCIRMF